MATGLNFKELAQEHPEQARRLALAAARKMNAVTSGAVQKGTAIANGQNLGLPNITAGMPGQGDLTAIPWPTVPDYGFNHHSACAKLAFHMVTWLRAAKHAGGEFLTEDDLLAVKAAGTLYALGRTAPGPVREDHYQRSADLADAVMHKDPLFWGNTAVRAEACRLIAGMGSEKPEGAKAIALHDAEAYEQCRFFPNTGPGIQAMRAGFARCISPWAREPANQRSWREYRGWK